MSLGDYPTPVTRLDASQLGATGPPLYVKREDLSSPVYGGNKVRPLELVFGDALEQGQTTVWATGSLGSNHAVATALHAPKAGLQAGALLWPQPTSITARDNLLATVSSGAQIRFVRTVVGYPFQAHRLAQRSGNRVQAPGAAVPLGALGHLSAALELATQVEQEELPAPGEIIVPVGSTCTAAGLLVGLRLAHHLGIGFRGDLPAIRAVRVTPWPITDRRAILWLANRTVRLLASLGGPALQPFSYRRTGVLHVEAGYLGRGYAHPTPGGRRAIRQFAGAGLQLDTTYSAKAADLALRRLRSAEHPLLLWATKSSAPLSLGEAVENWLPSRLGADLGQWPPQNPPPNLAVRLQNLKRPLTRPPPANRSVRNDSTASEGSAVTADLPQWVRRWLLG